MKKNNYFVVPTQRPEEFASTFGPSTPLATAPLAWAALKLFPEILFQQELKVLIFRWISSILVALAVAFFFLSIRVFLSSYSYWYSIVLLMLFAFGSSAWRGKRQPWIPVFTLSVTHIS